MQLIALIAFKAETDEIKFRYIITFTRRYTMYKVNKSYDHGLIHDFGERKHMISILFSVSAKKEM